MLVENAPKPAFLSAHQNIKIDDPLVIFCSVSNRTSRSPKPEVRFPILEPKCRNQLRYSETHQKHYCLFQLVLAQNRSCSRRPCKQTSQKCGSWVEGVTMCIYDYIYIDIYISIYIYGSFHFLLQQDSEVPGVAGLEKSGDLQPAVAGCEATLNSAPCTQYQGVKVGGHIPKHWC